MTTYIITYHGSITKGDTGRETINARSPSAALAKGLRRAPDGDWMDNETITVIVWNRHGDELARGEVDVTD